MDILKHIIPLVCLLTIHSEETAFVAMFHVIENDTYIYNILLDQTKSWWGDKIDTELIRCFINVYMKYMKDDKEVKGNQFLVTDSTTFKKYDKSASPKKEDKQDNPFDDEAAAWS
jgi:hypothetical protein